MTYRDGNGGGTPTGHRGQADYHFATHDTSSANVAFGHNAENLTVDTGAFLSVTSSTSHSTVSNIAEEDVPDMKGYSNGSPSSAGRGTGAAQRTLRVILPLVAHLTPKLVIKNMTVERGASLSVTAGVRVIGNTIEEVMQVAAAVKSLENQAINNAQGWL